MKTERLKLEPFEMKYLEAYYIGFNAEITKYQWPDPFETVEDARELLQNFIEEMDRGETLFYSILLSDDTFVGSVEVHDLTEDCPELGIWLSEREQKKGYAFEALSKILDYVSSNYHKTEFFYEADVRNDGSTKLLHRLESRFDIIEQKLERVVTDSGKELELQGYILKAKR